MDSGTIRVRFAPSPTGLLHIGNARTALFNWLFARHMGGKFILRIEDTDLQRSSSSYEKQLIQDLVWLGLTWDEGPNENDPGEMGDFGPYRQSKRLDIYSSHTAQLLAENKAYRCFCTPEELEAERQDAIARHLPQIYSGKCRNLSKIEIRESLLRGKIYSVRLKIPDHTIRFHDIVRGDLEFAPETVSDPILVRSAQGGTAGASPGVPVYNYVVTVDDALMGITHVIRGDDHISNTPKQVAIYEAFGWKVPEFAHLSTILGADRERLSKRHGATSISTFRQMGYLPEALVNYLCLLSWSPKDNREKLPLSEVIERFDLPQILRANARFDHDKLLWLQGEYVRELSDDRFCELSVHALAKAGLDTNAFPVGYVKAALDTCKGKIKLFTELPTYAGFYFKDEFDYDPEGAKKDFIPENKPRLLKLHEAFAKLDQFDAAHLEAALKNTAGELGVKAGVLVHPARLACTGNTAGPSLYHLMEVLGKDKVMQRIERALGQFG